MRHRLPHDAGAAQLFHLVSIWGERPKLRVMQSLALYDELTAGRTRFLRVDDLCRLGSEMKPALLPTKSQLEAEARLPLREKQKAELKQGIFLSEILTDPEAGTHLCHTMLLPREDSGTHLEQYKLTGVLDLGTVHLQRRGKASVLTMRNPRYLNAEDESTLAPMEIAVDVALLDPQTEVCVLRGDAVEHPKYNGRRLFGAGINLTHLYEGRIRYLWYLLRDLGFVNKIYRGVAAEGHTPELASTEKLWIAAVEGFAIGGHCQILLTIDYIIAAEDAYLTLPARKEGIIPGAANLRLPRFVGDRIARQAILAERRIDCGSAEGRLICDEIVPAQEMDAALERVVERLPSSGVVSGAGNRRAFRAGEESLDTFRRYIAVYAREQAYCHFSPALIANLERNWKTR